jgi:hypothetical protein
VEEHVFVRVISLDKSVTACVVEEVNLTVRHYNYRETGRTDKGSESHAIVTSHRGNVFHNTADGPRPLLPHFATLTDTFAVVTPAALDDGSARVTLRAGGCPLVCRHCRLDRICRCRVCVGLGIFDIIGLNAILRDATVLRSTRIRRHLLVGGRVTLITVEELIERAVAHTHSGGSGGLYSATDGHTQVGGAEPCGMAVDIQTGLVENTVGLVERFADVAMTDPLVAAMLITGAILVTFAAGVFGILSLGAVVSLIKRALPSSPTPPQQAR